VATRDGQEITLIVDEDMVISGDAGLGKYGIPLEKVSEICLIAEKENGS
jgi:hypothetical protein